MPRIVDDETFAQVLEVLRSRKAHQAADTLDQAPKVKESVRIGEQLGTRVWYEEPGDEADTDDAERRRAAAELAGTRNVAWPSPGRWSDHLWGKEKG